MNYFVYDVGNFLYNIILGVYYGKKYDLDYQKKLVFEYKYYGTKEKVYRIINKEKAKQMHEIRVYMKERMDAHDIGCDGNV